MARTLTEIDADLSAAETLVDKHENTDIPARVSDHVDNVSRISTIEGISADDRLSLLEADRRNLTADHTSPDPGYIATPHDGDPSNIQRIMSNQMANACTHGTLEETMMIQGEILEMIDVAKDDIETLDGRVDTISSDFDVLSDEFDNLPISHVAEVSISSTADYKDVQSSFTVYKWYGNLDPGFYIIFFKVGSDRHYCMSHIYTGGEVGSYPRVNFDYPPKYRNYSGDILGTVDVRYIRGSTSELMMSTSARCIDDINIIKMYKY